MKKIALVLAGMAALASGAHAQILLQWNTFGNAGSEATEASVFDEVGIGSSLFSKGTGVGTLTNSNLFGGSWRLGSDSNPTTLATAVSGDKYIEFTVTPDVGHEFSVTSLDFTWFVGTGSANSVTLRSSLDGYAGDLGSVTGMAAGFNTAQTINVAGLSNLSSAVTFRLYGYGATATSAPGGFDTSVNAVNVQLNGTVAAIPESSAASLAGAMLGLMAARRTQSRRTVS